MQYRFIMHAHWSYSWVTAFLTDFMHAEDLSLSTTGHVQRNFIACKGPFINYDLGGVKFISLLSRPPRRYPFWAVLKIQWAFSHWDLAWTWLGYFQAKSSLVTDVNRTRIVFWLENLILLFSRIGFPIQVKTSSANMTWARLGFRTEQNESKLACFIAFWTFSTDQKFVTWCPEHALLINNLRSTARVYCQ